MTLSELRHIQSVSVFKENELAGTLSRTNHGASFTYHEPFRRKAIEDRSHGVCFGLPPTQQRHDVSGTNLHPYFAGLLPEGLRLNALTKNLKTSEDDLFSLLLALGTNCIGDVYVRAEVDTELEPTSISLDETIEVEELSQLSFFELFQQSISDPRLQRRELDPGIPGVVPKVSASMISFPVSLAKRNREYILKLEPSEHPKLLENEHFFMQMARGCGFQVPQTQLVKDAHGAQGLLVERFDRWHDRGARSIRRLHQEDACQFLSKYPQDKYRLSLKDVAEGIQQWATSPIVEISKLLTLYIFSYLIGNGDLHGKNVSLIQDRDGRVKLSPVYDMLSTLPYGDRKMALKLGAKDENFSLADLITFGGQFGIPGKAIVSSISKLNAAATHQIAQVERIGFSKRIAADVRKTFELRAAKLARA